MGRYDKIRVYNGVAWVQPQRIRIYTGGTWRDLGANDSDIKHALNVYSGGRFIRATLDKQYVRVPGDSYATGQFKLLPRNGYCYCPNASLSVSGIKDTTFIFRATVKKTEAGHKDIFFSGNAPDGSCFIKIEWLEDGKLKFTSRSAYGSQHIQSITTTNSVGTGVWTTINIRCNKREYKMSVEFDGVVTRGNMWETWQITNCYNLVGDTGILFKDTLEVQASKYSNGSSYVSTNMSQASGSTAEYENVTHVDDSTTEVRWV